MNTKTNSHALAPAAVIFPDELADSLPEWGDPFLFDPADFKTLDYEAASWFEFNGGEPGEDWRYTSDQSRAPTARYALVAAMGGRAVYREIDRPAVGIIVTPEDTDAWSGATFCYVKCEPNNADELAEVLDRDGGDE